ncbi:ATP binding, partial [Coemansia sp. BCRC 34490]
MGAAPADGNGNNTDPAQESTNAPATSTGGAPSEPDSTAAVAVKSENGAAAAAAATLRKGKRMSRNYTSSTMVQTMHSISSESLQLSDAGSNISDIHGRHGDDDDDSDGSLSDLSSSSSSSSHLSDSVESDDDSFYDSLYDSDIDADENLAADDDESDLHASVSAVGSASVASAMHVQGSDKSTDMLHVSAAAATAAATAGGSGSTADQNKSVSRSASAASRNGRAHSNSNANAGANANANSNSSAAPAAPAKKKAWIKGAPIASGSFGSVYFGMNTRTGAIMAVKEVELPTPGSVSTSRNHRMVDALKHELDLLKGLDHKNVVKYLGTDMDDTNLYIFLEYVSGGSVSSALASFGMFPETLVRTYTAQILEGLVYLHAQGIIHRDIKGGNVLIDQDGSVKISDFGISKRVDEVVAASKKDRRASLQGSVFWMAPEVVKDTHYTFKGDVWSLGCLVIEMMTGSHP